ncbi:hypothetical protein BS17DRAFT_820859 [Gyrodon lividus]|nr:hypothetical protein BS17DRAFT_820859 [Gyrodon lividus]
MAVDEPMHGGRSSMVSAGRSALEQLIVPRAPASEPDSRNEPRNSMSVPYFFDMSSRPFVRRSEPSGPPGGPSFAIAPSSSVAFTGAPAPTVAPLSTGPLSAARLEAPTVVFTNSTESPVMVTSRTSQTYNTLFNLEPANAALDPSSQHRLSMGSSVQVPSELETNPWEDVAFGRVVRRARYPGPAGPGDSADPTSGSSRGPTQPWWST